MGFLVEALLWHSASPGSIKLGGAGSVGPSCVEGPGCLFGRCLSRYLKGHVGWLELGEFRRGQGKLGLSVIGFRASTDKVNPKSKWK